MSQVFQKKRMISDVLKWEDSYQFTREKMAVSASGSDVTIGVGEAWIQSTGTKFSGVSETIPAVPAVYTVKLASSGDSTENNTTIVGGVTFTAKAEPSTASGTTEYALTATAAQIATIIKNKGLTNFTVTVSGDTLTYTQTTAGTGDAVTFGSGTDTTVTGTVTNTQAYAAEVSAAATDFDCITLENRVVHDGETVSVLVLKNGPAIVDVDQIDAGSNTKAMTVTRLKELDIKSAYEPSVTFYQET